MERPPNGEDYSGPLPRVLNETRDKILRELGLELDDKTERIISGITGEQPESPGQRLRNFALQILSDIHDANPNILPALNTKIPAYVKDLSDPYFHGMAIVIRAMDIESGYSLIANLKDINENQIKELAASFESIAGNQNKGILDEVISSPRLPDTQFALKDLTKRASNLLQHSGPRKLQNGAGIMYRFIDNNSGSLLKSPTG